MLKLWKHGVAVASAIAVAVPLMTTPLSAAAEESMYDIIKERVLAAWENLDDSVYVNDLGILPDDAIDLYFDVMFTNGEYFYVQPSCSIGNITPMGYAGTIRIKYNYETSEIPTMQAAFDAAVDEAFLDYDETWSDIEKLLYFNDYLTAGYHYDMELSRYDAYNLLVEGNAVCQGYTLAMNVLCNRAGIPCAAVQSAELNHIWNVVEADGQWYHIDLTFNDPSPNRLGRVSHQYFLCSENQMRANGSHDTDDWYFYGAGEMPLCDDTTYDGAMWRDTNYAFVPGDNGNWITAFPLGTDYTSKNKIGTEISVADFTDENTLHKLPQYLHYDYWAADGGYWPGNYGAVDYYDGIIYFSDHNTIYQYTDENGAVPFITLSTDDDASYDIYGFVITATGLLKYQLSESPNTAFADSMIRSVQLEQAAVETTTTTTETTTTTSETTTTTSATTTTEMTTTTTETTTTTSETTTTTTTATTLPAEPVIYRFDTVTVTPGATVAVKLTISNDPGTSGASLYFAYDPALSLQSVKQGNAYRVTVTINPAMNTVDGRNNAVAYQWASSRAPLTAKDGATVLTFTFVAPEEPGTYPIGAIDDSVQFPTSIYVNELFDLDGNEIPFVMTPGAVIVQEAAETTTTTSATTSETETTTSTSATTSETETTTSTSATTSETETTTTTSATTSETETTTTTSATTSETETTTTTSATTSETETTTTTSATTSETETTTSTSATTSETETTTTTSTTTSETEITTTTSATTSETETTTTTSATTSETETTTTTSATTSETETTTTTTVPLVPTVIGDINNDGYLMIGDVIMLNRFLAEDENVHISAQGLVNADANGDGQTTAADSIAILKNLAGIKE